jgi:two-component system KDP operon response regulator KdpE
MAAKKILIVDDDLDVRQAMHVRLKANGYETFFATDALSSLAEARKQVPDLIILDLGLPDDDGYIVIERLKRYPALAVIPIIVVSARDLRANQDRAVRAGANVYLQKPVDNAELLAIIRHALGEPAQPEDVAITGNFKLFAS